MIVRAHRYWARNDDDDGDGVFVMVVGVWVPLVLVVLVVVLVALVVVVLRGTRVADGLLIPPPLPLLPLLPVVAASLLAGALVVPAVVPVVLLLLVEELVEEGLAPLEEGPFVPMLEMVAGPEPPLAPQFAPLPSTYTACPT